MSKAQIFRLGLEELAAGVSIAGFPDHENAASVAKAMLVANFGKLDPKEVKGRLMAANHSLMAKNLSVLRDDGPHLQPDFKKVIAALTQYDYTIRFSIGGSEKEKILTFYYKGKSIVKHENMRGVEHILSFASGIEQIFEESADFLQIDSPTLSEYPRVEIEQSALDEAKSIAATKPEKLKSFLEKAGIPKETAGPLAEDLIQPIFRGSVMRVELVENQMIADHGFLLLKGKQRAWFFPIVVKDDLTYASIVAGTKQTLEQEIQALL